MRILLDTHIFLWDISGDQRLAKDKQEHIRAPDNDIYLSVVSIWETIIKHQLGRLQLPQPPNLYLPLQRERHRISSLRLDEASVSYLPQLPPIHRDPFDRMLICQSSVHNLSILTVDEVLRKYPISIVE